MQISKLTAGPGGPVADIFPGGVRAATAVLNDTSGSVGLGRQLSAYQALASQWRAARPQEREGLVQALTDSPFARAVHSTLNAFTRAAWAGPDAVPPAPQIQILKAFDNLSGADRAIVSALQVDGSGRPVFASAADYRARLQAELDAVQSPVPERRPDVVTLSDEARARLAGGAPSPQAAPPAVAPRPDLAPAIAAYSKAVS